MNEAIAESRRHETAWPHEHYLWRLHPVVGWLNDRMLAAFGPHEAPVLAGVPGLARDETVFVISGLVPNRRSHPLVYEWVGVAFRSERFDSLVPFDALVERTGLGTGTPIANRGLSVDVEALARRLPSAARAPHLVAGLQARCLMKINALPVLWVLIERRMERRIGPCLVPATLNPRVWRRQIDRSHLNL